MCAIQIIWVHTYTNIDSDDKVGTIAIKTHVIPNIFDCEAPQYTKSLTHKEETSTKVMRCVVVVKNRLGNPVSANNLAINNSSLHRRLAAWRRTTEQRPLLRCHIGKPNIPNPHICSGAARGNRPAVASTGRLIFLNHPCHLNTT